LKASDSDEGGEEGAQTTFQWKFQKQQKIGSKSNVYATAFPKWSKGTPQ
jgi:hypothetical protein